MIKGKIGEVGEEICSHCAQNYSGECRAFEDPHSPEEREAREKGDALCIKTVAAFIGTKRAELKEEEAKEQRK